MLCSSPRTRYPLTLAHQQTPSTRNVHQSNGKIGTSTRILHLQHASEQPQKQQNQLFAFEGVGVWEYKAIAAPDGRCLRISLRGGSNNSSDSVSYPQDLTNVSPHPLPRATATRGARS